MNNKKATEDANRELKQEIEAAYRHGLSFRAYRERRVTMKSRLLRRMISDVASALTISGVASASPFPGVASALEAWGDDLEQKIQRREAICQLRDAITVIANGKSKAGGESNDQR